MQAHQDQNIPIPPKDEEEIELEKLVFGDMEALESNLKKLDNLYDYSSEDEEEEIDNEKSEKEDELSSEAEEEQDDNLFFIDEGPGTQHNDETMKDSDTSLSEEEEENFSEENAWEDPDDENISVSLLGSSKLKKMRKSENDTIINGKSYINRLRSQFNKIYPTPTWAHTWEQIEGTGNGSESDMEENERKQMSHNDTNSVLRLLETAPQVPKYQRTSLLPSNKISISRLRNANQAKLSKAAIQSLSFHHSHPLLLTGGFDRTLRIYHIDGKVNNAVTSLHLRNSPISTCGFSPLQDKANKNLVFAAGRRRYMNKWNLESGEVEKISRMYGHEQFQRSMESFKISPKGTLIGLVGSSGWCNLLSGSTGQWVKGFKVEGTIIDFDFTVDEKVIVIINTAGEVWEFALASSDNSSLQTNIRRRWQDNSGVGITKIKIGGPDSHWLAVGTNNGIVNIYDRTSFIDGVNPVPLKTIENLLTSISSLCFSPDAQILCIASRAKRDALRLVHLPSCSVFSNWPTSGTPLGRVTAVGFSPNNQMLAIGNVAGVVTLWRLNHY